MLCLIKVVLQCRMNKRLVSLRELARKTRSLQQGDKESGWGFVVIILINTCIKQGRIKLYKNDRNEFYRVTNNFFIKDS